MSKTKKRLAIITTHPIQYYAPWLRHLAERKELKIKVFYLWDFGVRETMDPEFKRELKWDIPLLEGYDHVFLPNLARDPGTHHFTGLRNPNLTSVVREFDPQAVLLIGYNYLSLVQFVLKWGRNNVPLFLRGDSHRLAEDSERQSDRAAERRKAESLAITLKLLIKKKLITILFRRFTAFLYVGKANKEYFRIHGVREEQLFFTPHAVDNDRFASKVRSSREEAIDWKEEMGIPCGHRVILFAGKFEEKKRPGDLLEAFESANLPNATLLMVGGGILEEDLRLRANGISENVVFAPFQNQSKMPRIYAVADLFVLPSYGQYETWGLAVNEAGCLGIPAIVSSHVGCGSDLILPGKTGWIFPAGDVKALSQSLTLAMESDQQRQEMGRKARTLILEKFKYPRATKGLLRALDAVTRN